MRCLRWVGLMSSVLFVGVLGGLLAPLPSDAGPTIRVKIDGTQVAPVAASGGVAAVPSILNTASSTCTAAEGTGIGGLGYTHCYALRTSTSRIYTGSNNRQWKMQTVPGLTARLRIADQAGQDKFSLVGVRFIPVPWPTTGLTTSAIQAQNTNESHVIEIIMTNDFTASVNVGNAAYIATDGGYIWAMRTGGEFSAGPTGATDCNFVQGDNLCDAVGDRVEFTGSGKFIGTTFVDILSPSGSAQNALPLSFTVAGPHADPILSFAGITNANMGQVDPTYPRFDCAKTGALTTCQPDVTQTLTVTLKGQDTFVLVGGGDGEGKRCVITPAEQQTLTKNIKILKIIVFLLNKWEAAHPDARLRAFIDSLQAIIDAAALPPSDPSCPGATFVKVAQAVQQATDQLAFIQHGAIPAVGVPPNTITINKHVCTTEPCTGLAPVLFTFSINTGESSIVANVTTDGTGHGTTVVPVPVGTYNVIESPQSGWNLTRAFCNEGENTNGIEVLAGANVPCHFTNSPATSNDLGIRLTWGGAPSDLDSHLYIPNGYHVHWPFANHGSLVISPYAELDLDDVTGFGPENITVVRWMQGTYQYFVHNYSETFTPGMTGSPALVELIQNGGTTTYVPPAGEGANLYWHVFNVTVNTDCTVSIVPINAWLASPPAPITQTENVCPDN